MERILILDLSTTCTGWAIFGNGKLESSGYLQLKKGNWLEMVIKLEELLKSDIQQIIIEDGYVGSNPKVSLNIGKLRGCVEYYARYNWITFKQFKPTQWKSYFEIKGKRKEQKEQSIKKVKEIFNLDVKDDEADAILLGKYYCEKGWKI